MRSPIGRRKPPRPALPRASEPPRRPHRFRFRGRADAALVTGRDVSAPAPQRRLRVRPGSLVALAAGAVCAALLLVALRVDAIRLRYRLGEAVAAEQQLRDQQRRLTVEVRHLRHPIRLEELGRELGLAGPACVIDLAAPSAASRCFGDEP